MFSPIYQAINNVLTIGEKHPTDISNNVNQIKGDVGDCQTFQIFSQSGRSVVVTLMLHCHR